MVAQCIQHYQHKIILELEKIMNKPVLT